MTRIVACGLFGLACGAAGGCAAGGEAVAQRHVFRLAAHEIAEASHGSRALFLRDLGDGAARDENWADAKQDYEEARLYQYGDDFDTQVALGQIYERQGDMKASVAAFSRAAYLRPGHLAGWYNLSRVVPRMPQLRTSMDAPAAEKPADEAPAGG